MQEFGFFLGRFHVLALHLPIGIVIVAVILDWLARRPRYAPLAAAAPMLWALAAISAVLTVALGYLHFGEGGFTGPSAEAHRMWGTITAVVAVGGWWLAARSAGQAGGASVLRLTVGIAMLALISITGHYGGNLTHGTTFLSEYAPSFLRGLIGAAPRRPAPTSVAAADPYLDVVQPLLEQRCGTCHNDDKRNGGFSMGSYDSTLVGGDTGRAIVPGNLEASELIYRTGLPPDDEAFMPAEGKTPLTAEQVAILRWWVGAGAPRGTTVGSIGAPADVEPLLAAQLGLAGPPAAAPGASATADDPLKSSKGDTALVARLSAAGFLVRQISQSDARLVVSVASPGTKLAPEALAALNAAAAAIVDLNLADTGLDDAGLAAIGPLPAATHLRLARNALTDAGIATLT
ncbi:MAG TPA: c-type cytochrome domain-containing protein, partial [Gammaproteobacteria bacterium]|nr:c-type cytochrome domain-containing protein [Gammaproteobacteria bacterium]